MRVDSAGMGCATVVLALAVLFPGVGSAVVALTVAVLVMTVPGLMLDGTLNTNWTDALAPAASDAMVHVMGPAGGALQENAGPVCCVAEATVVPAGAASVSVTLAASDGPAFETVTRYVTGGVDGVDAVPLWVTGG